MGAKKKLTKKEKQRLEAEKAEVLRVEMEKERQRKLEEEKERKMLERAEAERRQKQEIQENKIRRVQLQESCNHFNGIRNAIDKIFTDIRKQREWRIYMRCNGLPNTYDPGDLRKYIHMWLLHIERYNADERNWLLNTDERSILTQDQRIPDMTQANLRQLQLNLGDLYSKRIKEVLGILAEIEEATNDSHTLSKSIRKDLHNLKYTFRSTLADFLDEFSFKILSNIERDMELDGLIIARHQYQSEVFKTQLWTMREAPQPQLNPKEKLKLETSHTEIEFPLLEVGITLPPSIKCQDSALRVLWLSYDHFSDYCPSFLIPKLSVAKDLDIGKATKREWRKRNEILKNALEQEALKEAGMTTSALVDSDTNDSGVIDVDKIYSEYENGMAQMERKEKGIEGLKLKPFDVNLRSHRIVAGIYCVEYLEQPQQDTKLHARKYLRTLIYPNKLARKAFHQTYKPPPPVLPGVRRLPEEIEAEVKEMEANLEKLGSVTIKLPEDVMWFEPPSVCRWETAEETKISELMENGSNNVNTSTKSKRRLLKDRKVLEDFNMLNMPCGLDLYCLMQDFVVPRLPNGYEVRVGHAIVSRKSSSNRDGIIPSPSIFIESQTDLHIKHSLCQTNSPRPLFPKVIVGRELNLLESQLPAQLPDSVTLDTEKCPRVYMLSQLLKDLDEICESQMPYMEQQMEELSESLSASNDEEEDDANVEQDYPGISFLRTDYDWNFGKKKEVVEVVDSDEDTESEEEPEENMSPEPDEENEPVGKWSRRDVHDVKYNEDKLAITFKVGRLGFFGLAINWYSNLPFQTWEVKPDSKEPGTIVFSLTASVVSIEVIISAEGLLLNSFQGGTTPIVQDAVGSNMSFRELNALLTRAAINLFPEDDAFCYSEGTCEKNSVMEAHLYTCMGSMGLTHNFSWSRWNLLAGRRSCVLLMREIIENRKIPNFSTLHVTPLKACIVDCTDVSPCFNPAGIDGMAFYADLHHLAQEHCEAVSIEKHTAMDPMLRNNLIELLKATRPLSFC